MNSYTHLISRKVAGALMISIVCGGALTAAGQLRSSNPPRTVRPQATLTTATLNTLLYDFGNNLVGNKLSHTAVVVTNTGTSALTLSPTLTGDASFAIVAKGSCGTSLAAGASCDVNVSYLPTKGSYPKAQDAMLNLNLGNVEPGVPGSVLITGTSAVLKPGSVGATPNPLVAVYTMTLPFPGRFKVNFGLTAAYGRSTWFQSTDENHGVVSIYVAGMMQRSKYHMSALVALDNGIEVKDVDHVFQTGTIPTQTVVPVVATTTEGMTPQPGVEFTNPLRGLVVYDLQGNEIWEWPLPTPAADYVQGVKLLPNGDILATIGLLSNAPLTNPPTVANINEIREINLAGETVKELSVTDLNASLSSATCAECSDGPSTPLVVQTFHHDITPLPNGHWLILTNEIRNLSPTSTPPLTNEPASAVIGDVIVDVDENMQPVWVWNEFNHLDANRHPLSWPDWTHTNAVVYSPDDGNILVSMRHQNWIVKVKYDNGKGNGDILWHLGYQGDFKLIGGTSPVDWQYAQHDPGFFSPNTSGVFSLGVMDNGDDRIFPANNVCTTSKTPPAKCFYSTIPVFKIDETKMTATLTFHQKMPIADYSTFGGNTHELPNGNVEYDLCGVGLTSLVQEVTQDSEMKTVWNMTSSGNLYRAFRVPSLYPGVQW